MTEEAQVVVLGAGAIGLATACALASEGHQVTVVEKEGGAGRHQSSRNSGVIHAGYNLKPGSVKATYCREGNRRLRSYCEAHGVPVREGGILVVARTEGERGVLAELLRRGNANGCDVSLLSEGALHEREPHASGIEALLAREAASFDAAGYVEALAGEVRAAGATIHYGRRALGFREAPDGVTVATDGGPLKARVVVNAAGLFADRLAAALCPDLRIIPFRGYYAELVPARRHLVKSHLYAPPDLAFPFLGVHVSRRFDGRVIVGPGAMVALGREAYSFWQANVRDLASTLSWPGFYRMLGRPQVRSLVRSEVAKSLSLGALAREAKGLVPELVPADLVRSFAGNRAQVVDRSGSLVEDIVVRETPHAVHVLNAVSPGLTCSLPFGDELARRAAAKL
ncbi:MAG: L-2-hydroxyglutarate oxidase [Thermoplasmatota archaeon]